jgi:hypothetical protein
MVGCACATFCCSTSTQDLLTETDHKLRPQNRIIGFGVAADDVDAVSGVDVARRRCQT